MFFAKLNYQVFVKFACERRNWVEHLSRAYVRARIHYVISSNFSVLIHHFKKLARIWKIKTIFFRSLRKGKWFPDVLMWVKRYEGDIYLSLLCASFLYSISLVCLSSCDAYRYVSPQSKVVTNYSLDIYTVCWISMYCCCSCFFFSLCQTRFIDHVSRDTVMHEDIVARTDFINAN